MAMTSAVRSAPAAVIVPSIVLVGVGWVVLAVTRDHSAVGSFALMWIAMSVAMMIPTTVRPMLRASDGSAPRAWAFLGGFLLIWFAAGVPAYLVMNAITWTPFWIAVAWIAAGLYQVMPVMHRLVRSCSSVPYEGSPGRYGVRQGVRCVASCSPVMLAAMVTAMVLPGFALPVLLLLALTVLLCWERTPAATHQAMVAVGMGMIMLAVVGVMVLGGGAGHVHGG